MMPIAIQVEEPYLRIINLSISLIISIILTIIVFVNKKANDFNSLPQFLTVFLIVLNNIILAGLILYVYNKNLQFSFWTLIFEVISIWIFSLSVYYSFIDWNKINNDKS